MRPGQCRVFYSLLGVVEHSGRLFSGHYTAYVRVRRRHDQLAVNPARLTTLVTDAFGVACERARQRAQRSRPPPPSSDAAAADATAGADAEVPDAAGSREPKEPEPKQKPEPQKPQEPDPQPESGRWFHVSDTHVTEVTLDKMLCCERIV